MIDRHGQSELGGDWRAWLDFEAVVCEECPDCAGCKGNAGIPCPNDHVPCRCEKLKS